MKKTVLILIIAIGLSVSAHSQKTKQQPQTKQLQTKTDSTAKETLYLLGSRDFFQLLYKALTDHDDVTPNQLKGLAAYMEKNVAVIPVADTTKQKR